MVDYMDKKNVVKPNDKFEINNLYSYQDDILTDIMGNIKD